MVKLIENYAADYQAKTLTDEKAKKLTDELVAIGKAEAELQAASVPKLSKVLPPKKVARYLQIENKIRAVVKYELAKAVPLVE
jgi:polyhydroxyalkanoate synthesis regulator phasin